LNIITNHPAAVRKAVLASVTYDKTGLHPDMLSGPESGESADAPGHDLQIPFEREYRALAPDPGNRPALLAKVQAMELPEITPQVIAAIDVPHPAHHRRQRHRHARARSGDVPAARRGSAGRPGAQAPGQLAVLPGTSHVGVTGRANMLMTMIPPFLDTPQAMNDARPARPGPGPGRAHGQPPCTPTSGPA
jgi:hypothetical protein